MANHSLLTPTTLQRCQTQCAAAAAAGTQADGTTREKNAASTQTHSQPGAYLMGRARRLEVRRLREAREVRRLQREQC